MAEVKIDASTIKPNSYKYKEQVEQQEDREKLDPIVKKGGVVSTKKPLSQKFAETFLIGDGMDIKIYIIRDLVIPGVKNAVLDVIEMAFYGTVSGRRRSTGRRDVGTDYRSCYSSPSRREDRRERSDSRDRRSRRDDKLDYRNIILLNRDETEEVIRQLHKRIDKYGCVSIAELFDLIDEPISNHNDNNWGWKDPRDIGIRRVSRGYLIDVSEAEYLD